MGRLRRQIGFNVSRSARDMLLLLLLLLRRRWWWWWQTRSSGLAHSRRRPRRKGLLLLTFAVLIEVRGRLWLGHRRPISDERARFSAARTAASHFEDLARFLDRVWGRKLLFLDAEQQTGRPPLVKGLSRPDFAGGQHDGAALHRLFVHDDQVVVGERVDHVVDVGGGGFGRQRGRLLGCCSIRSPRRKSPSLLDRKHFDWLSPFGRVFPLDQRSTASLTGRSGATSRRSTFSVPSAGSFRWPRWNGAVRRGHGTGVGLAAVVLGRRGHGGLPQLDLLLFFVLLEEVLQRGGSPQIRRGHWAPQGRAHVSTLEATDEARSVMDLLRRGRLDRGHGILLIGPGPERAVAIQRTRVVDLGAAFRAHRRSRISVSDV